MRRIQYDSFSRRSELRTVHVSQSNLNQRAGRAGRVQPGDYYGLFHRDRVATLSPLPVPEMRVADLADLGLTVRAQQTPTRIAEFLADAVEPPPRHAVDAAVSDLVGSGAIMRDETITNLGKVLAKLPLHPALGKLVVLGILFKCLDPMIILGTAAKENVWERGADGTLQAQAANNMRYHFAEGTFSEHLALLHAYRELRVAVELNPGLDTYAWCRSSFLRARALHHIDRASVQVEGILAKVGLIPPVSANGKHSKMLLFKGMFGPAHLNTNSSNQSIIRAVLAAGLQPNMAWGRFRQSGRLKSFSMPYATGLGYSRTWESMLPISGRVIPPHLKDTMPLMLFNELVWTDKANSTFLSTMTPISPLVAALFGDQPRKPSAKDKKWARNNHESPRPWQSGVGAGEPGAH